jgi:hypothetical protein
MKAIKIILPIVVITLIGFFIWKWLVTPPPDEPVRPPTNQFITIIQSEIDSLAKSPANVFCQKFYKDIQYRINDFHKGEHLGKSESDNNQWKEILSRNLYSAYASKFAEQAMYVFNGSKWGINDIKFIRSEVINLKKSGFLDRTANYFSQIDKILAKYDEITGFISTCNKFSYSSYEIGDRFPNVNDKIQKSHTYYNSSDNGKVNNCTRLKDGLSEIPQKLFNKHIAYLHAKIQQNAGRYSEFNYQSDYLNTIYTPLKNQIEVLDNDIYGISDNIFNSGYRSLEKLLSDYDSQAYDYFRQLQRQNNRW